VEADDREHAAGGELGEGGGQAALDGADLVVDGDADALEGAGRGMDAALAPDGGGNGPGDQLGERAGAGQLAGAAGALDGGHDPAPVVLLAQIADGADQFLVAGGLQPLRGGQIVARVHAHVGPGIEPEGKAAVALVELEGGDPEVEQDAVEAGVGQRGQVAEVQVDETEGLRKADGRVGGALGGRRIAVQCGDAGAGIEHQPGVAAPAEGAVEDVHPLVRCEELEHLVQHDGKVPGGHGEREDLNAGRVHRVSSKAGQWRWAPAGATAGSHRKPWRVSGGAVA
jgi:hypothetical protein